MKIADFHCDLLSYLAGGEGCTAYDAASHAALPQMEAGGVALQTLAIYTKTAPGSAGLGIRQSEVFFELEKKYPEFKRIKTVLAIENASSFCEEGEPLEVGLSRINSWWNRAGKIGYISLTWNGENRFGGGNATQIGLKPDGHELLNWMDGKKIAIDLSHTSDKLAEDVLKTIEDLDIPVVASHSNFRAVCDHPRNLPDPIAQEIGARKGVIGLNFVRAFLGKNGPEDFLKQAEHADKLGLLDHWCFGADFFADHDVPLELAYLKPFFHREFDNSSCYPQVIGLFLKYLSRDVMEKIAYLNLAQFLGLLLFFCSVLGAEPSVQLGVDLFFAEHAQTLAGKNVALVTNQTGVNSQLRPTLELLQEAADNFKVVAIFSPEHGLAGMSYAEEKIGEGKRGKVSYYSLHGDHLRPTAAMLKGIDVILYDIQEIGCRSYTYATTLYYVMEEAAKKGIEVIVLDRPNPLGGLMVDGPMLQESSRSFVGYINVPYCHGMTIGELARFFNEEYRVKCQLRVIPMKGWKRSMTFQETGLVWIPTSPQIPEADTPFFYPTTGLLGGLTLVSIGIGYTLPFKVVGAPWIEASGFADALNRQKLKGVKFLPFHFKPFFGLYKQQECQGVRIVITDPKNYRPVTADYLIMGVLKSLYPHEVGHRLKALPERKRKMFSNVNGNIVIWDLLLHEQYPGWKMASVDQDKRAAFLEKREKYLLY